MEFITTGNRIAVENFEIGYFYTITMLSGNYFQACCTGIGSDFVMFSRDEPDLLFSLTMQSAADVSSIELYGGGSGTNDYNDLSNKPQINSITLIGNKSLSDLGIQDTISDLNTIRSGADAGATAVQPADLATALATKQDTISDLNTIRSGATAGSTAVQPAAMATALAAKQDTLSSAQLAAVNSGIDSTKVAQIETNKNNIYYIEKANGKKNLVPNFGRIENGGCVYTYGSGGLVTVTGTKSGSISFAMLINNESLSAYGLSAGDQIVLVSDSANIGTVVIFEDSQGKQDAAIFAYNETKTATIPSGRTKWYLRLQVKPATTGTINETVKPMVCDKKLYDIDPTVTPYAMSNAELTAAIQALQAQLANQ